MAVAAGGRGEEGNQVKKVKMSKANIIAEAARATSELDPVGETLSGRSYASAWAAIAAALDEVVPGWNRTDWNSPVENAISAIRELGGKK